MGRLLVALAVMGALAGAPVAAATPEDPYGEDWVAIALAPADGGGGYGASGTPDDAVKIALDECSHHGKCVVASAIEYGCVAFVLDTQNHWAGGRGPDKDAAMNDAVGKLPDPSAAGMTGGSACSTPLTRP